MKPIEIRLPWPPTELSPNARGHWSKVMKAKRAYRSACLTITLGDGPFDIDDGPLLLDLTFHPPDRRSYDRDNLISRIKAGIDGLADGLEINDKRFTTLAARVSPEVGGYITVKISGDDAL